MTFQDKVVLVTGGASGIGRAISERFFKQGASVVIADINLEAASLLASDLKTKAASSAFDQAATVIALQVDVSLEHSVHTLLKEVESQFGKLNCLINCAGIDQPTSLAQLDERLYDQVMGVDLKGVYLMSRAASALLEHTGNTAIVNISSIMAWYTHPNYVAYTAAKAGVIGMTRALATALGPTVRVNAVCPGFIDTAIWQRNLDAMEPSVAMDYAERIRKMHPVSRRGKPEDVAAAVTFLCSTDASFITGAHLVVDGGVTTTLLSDQ